MTLKKPSTEPPGCHVTSPILPPFSAYAGQLSRGVFWAGCEHDAERRGDTVETLVRELESFGVADPEIYRWGERLCGLDHLRAEIDPDHACAMGRQAARRPTGASGDIEKAFAGHREDPPHQCSIASDTCSLILS
jgi:hypothetical protein